MSRFYSSMYQKDKVMCILKFRFTVLQNQHSKIQSGPHNFEESRFVMTFLSKLGVTEILYSLVLVLEGKAA